MLYFVGTPIGNLKDFSFRAVETLKNVDEIGCEDTRHSINLLNAYEIKKPLFSYHKFNERECGEKIIEKLKQGKNIAIITDAGMPVISDPGNILAKMLIESGLEFTTIPSGSAFTMALVMSGLPSDKFCFLGFLPEKQGERKEFLSEYKDFSGTLIFYSAPHDVVKDVNTLFENLGARKVALVREITKLHEEVIRFTLGEKVEIKELGEFVIVVEGANKKAQNENLTNEELIELYINSGLDKKEALKKVAKERNIAKSELYKYTIGK